MPPYNTLGCPKHTRAEETTRCPRLTASATTLHHQEDDGVPAHLVNVNAEYLAECREEFAPLSMRSEQAGMTLAIVQVDVVYDVQIVGIGILPE